VDGRRDQGRKNGHTRRPTRRHRNGIKDSVFQAIQDVLVFYSAEQACRCIVGFGVFVEKHRYLFPAGLDSRMASRSKKIVTGMVVALCGAVGYTNIYLPFYSRAARDRREQKSQGSLPKQPESHVPGSMWGEIAKVEKELAEQANSPAGVRLDMFSILLFLLFECFSTLS